MSRTVSAYHLTAESRAVLAAEGQRIRARLAERRAQAALEEHQKRAKAVIAKATGSLETLVPQIVGLGAEQADVIRKAIADLRALVAEPKG